MPPDIVWEIASPEHRLLTEMDPQRYPELVRIAEETAVKRTGQSRVDLCKALLSHFSEANGYEYTLDYRDVNRNKELDPVEDFVGNHKTGHCAMFASALTLMLRSLDIPARYVVGFHGSDFNQLTDCYVIHGRQAHAWVEAYLPPDECTEEMFRLGIAGPGGAWLTLDPTPAGDFGSANEAIDLARSIWQDYVISPDHNKQTYNGTGPLRKASSGDSSTSRLVESVFRLVQSSRLFQISLISGVLMLIGFSSLRTRTARQSGRKGTRSRNPIREFAGRTVSIVSRNLGTWIAGEDATTTVVPFYRQLERLLKKYFNLQRQPYQTHREFALQAGSVIASRLPDESASGIQKILQQVTDAYYQVRFATIPLDKNTADNIENQIRSLEKQLKDSGKNK